MELPFTYLVSPSKSNHQYDQRFVTFNQFFLQMRLLTLFNSVFFSPSATAATKQFLITDYGAIGDNKTINTFAIQNAIDAAAFAGGGNVVIPSTGVFKTATLRLKSNVFLYLPTGSTLYASANVSDYIAVSGGNWDNWDLFHTVNQENTGIIGDTSGIYIIERITVYTNLYTQCRRRSD